MDRQAVRPRVLLEGWLLGGLAIALACGVLFAAGWLRIVPGAGRLVGLRRLLAHRLSHHRGARRRAARPGLPAHDAARRARCRRPRWASRAYCSALVHLRNAGVTVQSICIVTLAGVFLGAIRLALRSVYAATAAHLAWNWVIAVAFHASVSGIRFDAPDYRIVDAGPDWAHRRRLGSGGRPRRGARHARRCWPISIARLRAARSHNT